MNKINDAGIALIKSFESCVLRAYLPTPDDVLTIGFGHTGGDVFEGQVINEEEADLLLKADLEKFEKCVSKAVTVPLTDNEYAACVSLAFNIGCGAFSGSTLVKMLNNSDFDGAKEQFARWNKQAGKVLAGLTRRREAEAELFDTA